MKSETSRSLILKSGAMCPMIDWAAIFYQTLEEYENGLITRNEFEEYIWSLGHNTIEDIGVDVFMKWSTMIQLSQNTGGQL